MRRCNKDKRREREMEIRGKMGKEERKGEKKRA